MRAALLALLLCTGCATLWQHPDGRAVECRPDGAHINGREPAHPSFSIERLYTCEDAATIAGFTRVR